MVRVASCSALIAGAIRVHAHEVCGVAAQPAEIAGPQ
jgi:hypothetical protein